MCDYSLHNVKTRPAKVGDKLTTREFGTGTHGFAASEDASVAVCLLPGTELSFAEENQVLAKLVWVVPKSGQIQNRDLSTDQSKQVDDSSRRLEIS
jgi:hypothetical protein